MTNVISFILPALLIAVFLFTTDNAYSQPDDSNAYVTGITSERAKSLVGIAIGLASVIVAWRVKARSAVGTRNWVIIALVMGLVALILSVIHLGNVNGGFGTGGGKAGSIVALVLGLIGTSLSAMALRTRRK